MPPLPNNSAAKRMPLGGATSRYELTLAGPRGYRRNYEIEAHHPGPNERRGTSDAGRKAVSSRRGDDRRAPQAIKAGRTTCVAIVQYYIDRARAYNGVCSVLVTEGGGRVAEAEGAVRATAPMRFPTESVKASAILPDLDKYKGPPL